MATLIRRSGIPPACAAMGPKSSVGYPANTSRNHPIRAAAVVQLVVVAVCSALTLLTMGLWVPAAASQRGTPPSRSSHNPALVIPRTVVGRCAGGTGKCELTVPAAIRRRSVVFPKLSPGSTCPTSAGSYLDVPGASGLALKGKVVSLLIPQRGDVAHGSVQLASSDVVGWYGIKTHWFINPSYSGWVVVRAEQLGASTPVAALGEADIGPVIIPPGPTPNTYGGWRQQPSGTYVKGPGCFGFQIDGSTFQEHLVLMGVLAPSE